MASRGCRREVVDDQQLDPDQLAHLGVVAGVEARRPQALLELVGALEVDPDAPPAGDVAEGGGEERLADPDRAEDEHVAGLLDEAHRDELSRAPRGRRSPWRSRPSLEGHQRVELPQRGP